MNVFKVLVSAIAAMLILALVFFYLIPFFFPVKDPKPILEAGLENAELELGSYKCTKIAFPAERSFIGRNFDTSLRSVTFECNDNLICCGINDPQCNKIAWDERRILINQAREIETCFRCKEIAGLKSCRIYIGQEPGQLTFDSIPEALTFDHSKPEPFKFELILANTGKQVIVNDIDIKVNVYQSVIVEREVKNILVDSKALQPEKPKNLLPGEQTKTTIELEKEIFSKNGNYEIELIADALDGGQDIEKVKVVSINAVSERCEAIEGPEKFVERSNKCFKLNYCNGCSYAVECANLWKSMKPSAEIELGDKDSALESTDSEKCIAAPFTETALPLPEIETEIQTQECRIKEKEGIYQIEFLGGSCQIRVFCENCSNESSCLMEIRKQGKILELIPRLSERETFSTSEVNKNTALLQGLAASACRSILGFE